jgi:hypothetical protein
MYCFYDIFITTGHLAWRRPDLYKCIATGDDGTTFVKDR